MALLTTYSAANRVVNTDGVVSYSSFRVSGEWKTDLDSQAHTFAFEYRRTRSKSYSYVGMTYDTARDCAATAALYYTRSKTVPEFGTTYPDRGWHDVDGGKELMADIAIQKRGGNMYDVVINVNESDVRMSFDGTLQPSTMFNAAIYQNRFYDTSPQAFAELNDDSNEVTE